MTASEKLLSEFRRMKLAETHPGLFDVVIRYKNRKLYSRVMGKIVNTSYVLKLWKTGAKFKVVAYTDNGFDITFRVLMDAMVIAHGDSLPFQLHVLNWKKE